MGAKIKVYGLVFYVLYVVVLAKADDGHHIEQRILEKNDINGTLTKNAVPNILKKSLVDDVESALSSTLDPSQKLEQALDKLGAQPSLAPNNKKSIKSKNNKPVEVKILLHNTVKPYEKNNNAVADTHDIPSQKFNVSCLLRNNSVSDAIEAPPLFPNGTSVNGTISIIEGNPEKLQTMIAQTYNATEKTNIQSDVQNKTAVNDKNRAAINNKIQTTEANNNTVTDTEVKDLLHDENMEDADHSDNVPQKPQGSIQTADDINDDTKLIQNGENTEDKLRHPENSKNDDDDHINQRHLAAIIVSSLVAVSVLCYAALLIWRRYLENRYGSRTMLVNEVDFDDPSDMRNFSI